MNVCINDRRQCGKYDIESHSTKKQRYNPGNKTFLHFTCVFINCNYIIDSFYLIKYKAKQKHLLPFNVTNNGLKEILY